MKIKKLSSILKNHNYFPKYSRWGFILLFLLISIIYNYQDILYKPPQSIHLWRQADCLSITMNYYQDNNPFLEPSIHNLGRDGEGKTVSDFPLIYYTVAQLWKIFGQHEFIYRALVLLIFFSGLFSLFKLYEEALKDSVMAIVFSLLMFASPTLAYYANNFLMDIPAFSFALVGLYFFVKFYRSSSHKYLYFFALFYTLAGLLKISSLISFMAIFGLFLLERINVTLKPGGRIFRHPIHQFIILAIVLVSIAAWYLYADYYNSLHNSGIFLVGILPIWELDSAQIQKVFYSIREHMRWDYFRPVTQFIFVLIFISTLLFYRKARRTWLILSILVAIAVIFFIILFYQALDQHDYYTINLFILIPIVVLTFLKLLKDHAEKIYFSVIFRILVLVFLIHSIDFAKRRLDSRYKPMGWENSYYTEKISAFNKISPYLRSIGIEEGDRVISISDNTINTTLYMMNQKGWTNYGIKSDSLNITKKIQMGARYLVVYDRDNYEDDNIQPFLKNKIGEFNNIDIYSLSVP
jgi:hypothetical protein